MSELEMCCKCGDSTGRAGKGEDSLYCDGCDTGPYCPECWDLHHSADDKLATAERRLAAADELVANNDRDDWLDLPNGTTMTADTLLWEMFAAQDADA
jgi:hypothetical protein